MHRPTSTARTIGTHSSSRAGGRSATGAPPAPGSPDAPGTAATLPSFSSAAADPGAIADSATSKRSTANRIGASGSAPGGGREPDALADGRDVVGDGAAGSPEEVTASR